MKQIIIDADVIKKLHSDIMIIYDCTPEDGSKSMSFLLGCIATRITQIISASEDSYNQRHGS